MDYRLPARKLAMSYEESFRIVDSITHSTRVSTFGDYENNRNLLFLNADKKFAADYCK